LSFVQVSPRERDLPPNPENATRYPRAPAKTAFRECSESSTRSVRLGPVTAQPTSTLSYGKFDVQGIRVRTEPMLRIHGYPEPDHASPRIREAAERMAACAERLFRLDLAYRPVTIRRCDGRTLTLETDTTLNCGDSGCSLTDCTTVVAFFLTAGEELDEEGARLQSNGHLLDALFLETAGWLGIEAATKSFAAYLRGWGQAHGYALRSRLAPGCGTWPLADQKPLLSLFDGLPVPVRLLESCAMTPKMSRSGLYGLRLRQATKPPSQPG